MIECVANFSEGRRQDVIDALAQAVDRVSGAVRLDVHSDADHNRSVITFAGSTDAVAEAAFQAVRRAAQLIDLSTHTGQHPRVGAADVVPFVPLEGATMAECVAVAHTVGQRIGVELELPVYLYGAAATRPERRDLPNLRRGQYEGLREVISQPEWTPDFGPARLGPAGAVIVGAREPLIAYNVYLATGDVEIAKQIAKAIRGSSGGLRGVRALGLLVDGRAQVSMNLTDFRTTPVYRAVEMIRREAAAFGVSVASSELVGLMPDDALFDTARYYLQLHDMRAEHVLERRIRQAAAAVTTPSQPASNAWALAVEALAAALDELAAGTAHHHAGAFAQLAHDLRACRAQRSETAQNQAQLLEAVERLASHAADLLGATSDTAQEAGALLVAGLAATVAAGAQARARNAV